MTDTNRMTDQDRRNGWSNRPPDRFEQEHQRGFGQNDYYTSRDHEREASANDHGRARQRSPSHSDRFIPGSTFDDHDEFTHRGVGYGRDRFGRGTQGQGDWTERLWRYARGQEGGLYDDRGQHRFGEFAKRERDYDEDFRYGDGQRHSEYGRREDESRFGRGSQALDWRESHFGKGPKGYKRSDELIKEEINLCLFEDHRIDASDIEVNVQNGEVSLTGTVSDRRCRREVEDLVESISGVSDVSNQLKIQRSNGNA